jgi:hypothetical protein
MRLGQPVAETKTERSAQSAGHVMASRSSSTTLGGLNRCKPANGFFSNTRARGPHWKTDRHLAIGDRKRRLKNLYPGAEFHGAMHNFWPSGWWLVKRTSQFGSGGSYPGDCSRTSTIIEWPLSTCGTRPGVTESPGVGYAPAVVSLVYSAGVVCGSKGSIAGASPKVCWRVGRYLGWRIRLSAGGCEETAVA